MSYIILKDSIVLNKISHYDYKKINNYFII